MIGILSVRKCFGGGAGQIPDVEEGMEFTVQP